VNCLLALVVFSATPALAAAPAAKEPVKPIDKPGTYTSGPWTYQLDIHAPGSESETRIGRLSRNGREIHAPVGSVIDTPLGRFMYFSRTPHWNQGWLNAQTYNTPVFDKQGRLAGRAAELAALREPLSEKDIESLRKQAIAKGVRTGVPWRRENILRASDRGIYVLDGDYVLGFDGKRLFQWTAKLPYLGMELKLGPGTNLLAHAAGKGDGGALVCLSPDGKVAWKWEQRSGRILRYEPILDASVVVWTQESKESGSNKLEILDAAGRPKVSRENIGPFWVHQASDVRAVNTTPGHNALVGLNADGKISWQTPIEGEVPTAGCNTRTFMMDHMGHVTYACVVDGKVRVTAFHGGKNGWTKEGFSGDLELFLDTSDEVLVRDAGRLTLYDARGKELYRGKSDHPLEKDEFGNFVVPEGKP
jgi:hypothetical protein